MRSRDYECPAFDGDGCPKMEKALNMRMANNEGEVMLDSRSNAEHTIALSCSVSKDCEAKHEISLMRREALKDMFGRKVLRKFIG